MHIRCGSCHGSVWVESAKLTEAGATVTCAACGKVYSIDFGGGADVADRLAAEARQLVRETQIDLPSAYAVLLGVTTLEEVLELGDSSSTACQTAAGIDASRASKSLAYDADYRPAVLAGFLSPLQAMQRGRRENYATLVAGRYQLPQEVAYDVADNKVSLLEALRRRATQAGARPEAAAAASITMLSRPRSDATGGVAHHGNPSGSRDARAAAPGGALRLASRIMIVLLIATVAVVVIVRWSSSEAPTLPVGTTVHSLLGAQVRADRWGRLLEISAESPKKVLAAYCAGDADHRYEPLDVVPSEQDGPRARLGLLRRAGRSGELMAIVVREDLANNRWVAGDGSTPIVPHTAPRAAVEAYQPH